MAAIHATSNLKRTLSTITSPAFLEVVIIYRDYDFCGLQSEKHPDQPPLREIPQTDKTNEALQYR